MNATKYAPNDGLRRSDIFPSLCFMGSQQARILFGSAVESDMRCDRTHVVSRLPRRRVEAVAGGMKTKEGMRVKRHFEKAEGEGRFRGHEITDQEKS